MRQTDNESELPLEADQYEVNEIVDYVNNDGLDLYCVKWNNYDPDENTWEPILNLCGVIHLVNEYRERNNLRHIIPGQNVSIGATEIVKIDPSIWVPLEKVYQVIQVKRPS